MLASLHWTWWYRSRLGPQRTASGVWEAGLTFIPIVVIAVYWCGFSNRTPYLMRVDVMKPAYNFEPKCRVLALTREDWTTGTGLLPMSRGTSGLQMDHRFGGAGSMDNPLGGSAFQAEVFAILACAHDIKAHGTPQKHTSICSDSLTALKALRAIRTSPHCFINVRRC
jgi:hypothetical protein